MPVWQGGHLSKAARNVHVATKLSLAHVVLHAMLASEPESGPVDLAVTDIESLKAVSGM